MTSSLRRPGPSGQYLSLNVTSSVPPAFMLDLKEQPSHSLSHRRVLTFYIVNITVYLQGYLFVFPH